MNRFLALSALLSTGFWYPLNGRQASLESLQEEFRQADRDFSRLSETNGPLEAFLFFLTADAYLLHPGAEPVSGRDAIQAQFSGFPKDGRMTWEPAEADCAKDGTVGFTKGAYRLEAKNSDGTPRVRTGTYLTLWKRQPDGKLKAIADMGSPQPMPEDSEGRVVKRKAIKEEKTKDGEFGLSFGNYEVLTEGRDGRLLARGKYVSGWRGLADGTRRILLDAGNSSPLRADSTSH